MRVGFFVTCLVDLMRPSVGFAALKLLEAGGAEVYVPPSQTCCGQPAYNSGDRADAIALARKVIEEFEGCDYLVAPSGSCSGMIRTHYGELFAGDPPMQARAEALAAKTWEITSFLRDVLKLDKVPGRFDGTITYHDCCAGLREMGVKSQPRALLAKVAGLTLREMAEPETCCGFGGAFSIKFGEISARLADNKCQHCHNDLYDTWKTSMHAKSWNDQIFQSQYQDYLRMSIARMLHADAVVTGPTNISQVLAAGLALAVALSLPLWLGLIILDRAVPACVPSSSWPSFRCRSHDSSMSTASPAPGAGLHSGPKHRRFAP